MCYTVVMADSKVEIEIRLSCAHRYKVEKRPNPRKEWPDPQTCPECKKKLRVTEIHTKDPSAMRDTSMKLTAKPKRKKAATTKGKGKASGNRKRKS